MSTLNFFKVILQAVNIGREAAGAIIASQHLGKRSDAAFGDIGNKLAQLVKPLRPETSLGNG